MIKRFSILRYASLLQSISLSYIKFNKKNRFHCNTVSSSSGKRWFRIWNALHGRGSRSRGKKMLIFRGRNVHGPSVSRCFFTLEYPARRLFFTRGSEARSPLDVLQIGGGGLTFEENGPRYGGWERLATPHESRIPFRVACVESSRRAIGGQFSRRSCILCLLTKTSRSVRWEKRTNFCCWS